MMIKGILFDIGDTLIGATALQHDSLKATVHKIDWIQAKEDFIASYLRADAEFESKDMPDLNHLYSDERIVLRAFEILTLMQDAQRAKQFVNEYRAELRQHLQPDLQLQSTLENLNSKNIELGIASNGTTREQLEQLEKLEIKKFFFPILISEALHVRKPDPAILRLALNDWHLPPNEILVVGDRPDWECLAAARAGMRSGLTLQFIDHRADITAERKPDFIIKHYSELPSLIERS